MRGIIASLEKISDWLHKFSSGWITLAALLIFLGFTATILPDQASQSAIETGDVGSPDTSFFYSAADLYEFARAYGERGREAYIRARFTFDVIWPLVYAFFLATSLSWIAQKGLSSKSWLQRANLVPVIGAVFDFLENFSTSLVMFRYPNTTLIVDWLAPVFTLVKWVFVNGSFVFLVALIAISLYRRFRPQNEPPVPE